MSLCCLTPTSYQLTLGNYPGRSTSFRKPTGQEFARRLANLVSPTVAPWANLISTSSGIPWRETLMMSWTAASRVKWPPKDTMYHGIQNPDSPYQEKQRLVALQVLQETGYTTDAEGQIGLCQQHHSISIPRSGHQTILVIHQFKTRLKPWDCAAEVPGEIVLRRPIKSLDYKQSVHLCQLQTVEAYHMSSHPRPSGPAQYFIVFATWL